MSQDDSRIVLKNLTGKVTLAHKDAYVKDWTEILIKQGENPMTVVAHVRKAYAGTG